ncbi:hypothetical protein BC940DRAFT_305217 [Gongronella butleri]|nr:hypothetical protein BC940DRAFT_305217 [Gongronella butleri]
MSVVPLTAANLKHVAVDTSMESRVEQFYQQIPPNMLQRSASHGLPEKKSPLPSPARRRRPQSTSRRRASAFSQQQSDDASRSSVILAPRVLPFPYHNDSHFLPIVEKHRHIHRAKSIASLASSSIDSVKCASSALSPPPSPAPSIKRRKLTSRTQSNLTTASTSQATQPKMATSPPPAKQVPLAPPLTPAPTSVRRIQPKTRPQKWLQKIWNMFSRRSLNFPFATA